MKRKFLSSLIILLGANLLIKPLWVLGIDRTVQNIVGPHEYGLFFSVFNFSFLFNILLDLGITNFNQRNIAQNNQLLNKHFSAIFLLKFVLALIYLSITFVTAFIIGYSSRQFYFLLFLSINQFLLSFILYLRSNISALHLFKLDSFLSVLDRIIMIFLCSLILWGHFIKTSFKIEWFIYVQTIAYILTFLICLIIVVHKSGFKKPTWNYPFFLAILKESLPYALLILLMTFYNRIDSVMLERLLENGHYYSGIYAAAYRLLDAFNMIAYLFAVLLLPIFSRMIKFKENVTPIIRIAFSLLYVFSLTIAVVSFFFNSEIISILYHYDSDETKRVFSILMCCVLPVSITYIFGTLLTANGDLKKLNKIALSGMLINIFLNMIFIPYYKTIGAASVSLLTQLITSILQALYAIKIFNIKIYKDAFIKFLIYTILLIAGSFFIKIFVSGFIIALISILIFSILVAISLKIIKPIAFIKLYLEKN